MEIYMSRPVPYEQVLQTYLDRNCVLLVGKEEYINTQTKMKYKCACGNISEIPYNNFRRTTSCKKCIKKEVKHGSDEISKILNDYGYTLIDIGNYKGVNSKITIKCPSDHIYKVRFSSFYSQNNRCNKCVSIRFAQERKNDFDYVQSKINVEGYLLLDTEYINNKTDMRIQCPADHIFEMSFGEFVHVGNRCPECFGTFRTEYEVVKSHIESFGYSLLSKTYTNAHKYLTMKCDRNHKFKMKFNNFKNLEQRCRECYLDDKVRGENNPRFNPDRTRLLRMTYLGFDNGKLHILKDDPNYTNHINSQITAKASSNIWDRSDYTVDHIFPRKAFIDNDLDNIHGPLVVKGICNLRENLRIIPKSENGKKAGKYNQEEFIEWFNSKLTD